MTGDVSYAQDVIAALKRSGERQDIWKYLTQFGAVVTIRPCRNDAKVRAAPQAAAKDRVGRGRRADALQKPPSAIRAATVQVLKAQKAAGVWK